MKLITYKMWHESIPLRFPEKVGHSVSPVPAVFDLFHSSLSMSPFSFSHARASSVSLPFAPPAYAAYINKLVTWLYFISLTGWRKSTWKLKRIKVGIQNKPFATLFLFLLDFMSQIDLICRCSLQAIGNFKPSHIRTFKWTESLSAHG